MDRSRSIFITGAASGIGEATAILFAQRGWFVGCFDIDSAGIAALKVELGDCQGMFATLDVTDRSAVGSAVMEFGSRADGMLDILFNNAGIDAKGAFSAMNWETIMAVVNVNLIGGLSLIHSAFPLLAATPGSLCFSTASASAIFGTSNLAIYSATKHAIKGLTEALAAEFAPQGVRAADVLPGIIDTGMLAPEIKAMLPADGPLRPLPAADVADVVWQAYHGDKLHWYLPSELAAYDVEVTANPESTRDRRIAGSLL
jgi:NAD(P)-dependent dehydrogenase (short-subunit alcohol dehydrogenase family)